MLKEINSTIKKNNFSQHHILVFPLQLISNQYRLLLLKGKINKI